MQFYHPSCISLNTLVRWPSVAGILESQPYWDMIFVGFHTSVLLTSLSTKPWGCWLFPSSAFYSWKVIFFSPPKQASWHHSGLDNVMATSWSKLIYTETEQRRGSVSHTQLTCLASPFANEPYLTPTLIVFHLLPPALLSTLFFISLLILFNTNPSFQCLHSQLWWQVAVETVKLTFQWIGGWLIVDQAACSLVCWPRLCHMQIGCLPSACLQFRVVSNIHRTDASCNLSLDLL